MKTPFRMTHAEWEVMAVVWQRAPVAASVVVDELRESKRWSLATVRTLLRRLVNKGALKQETEGKRYLYRPAMPKEKARKSALRNLLKTFFGGRATDAVAALLEVSAGDLSDEDLDRLRTLIEQARKEDR